MFVDVKLEFIDCSEGYTDISQNLCHEPFSWLHLTALIVVDNTRLQKSALHDKDGLIGGCRSKMVIQHTLVH